MTDYLWRQTLECDGEPVLSLSQRLPEFPDEGRVLHRLNRYYQRMGQLWRARWESALYLGACGALTEARAASRPFRPWSAELDYAVTLESENLLSLYVDATERGADHRPLTVRAADTWDLRTGAPCAINRFLPRRRWRSGLRGALKSQVLQRLESGESLLFQDAVERVPAAFSAHRFYLTEDALTVYFPMLSLGSAAEGLPLFTLPRLSEEISPEKS